MLVKIMLKLDTRFIEDTSKETHILHREAPTKEEEHEKIRTQRGAWLGMSQRRAESQESCRAVSH